MTKEEFIVKYTQMHYGDESFLKQLLGDLAGVLYTAFQKDVVVVTDDITLTQEDSGKIFLVGTDAKVITLPSTLAGWNAKFINIGAAGHNTLTLSPQEADGISGTITLAASVVVDAGVVNKDLINTKATAVCGDSVELIGTGIAGTAAWVIANSTGIWAAEG